MAFFWEHMGHELRFLHDGALDEPEISYSKWGKPEKGAADGYAIVPIDPTPAMIEAASDIDGPETAKQVWDAMMNASPD